MPTPGKRHSRSFQTRTQEVVAKYGKIPGYHTRLPFVFPYHLQVPAESAAALGKLLCQEIEEVPELGRWFAITGHPATVDGHVTLWLSAEAADWLLTLGHVSEVRQYITES